MKLFCIRKPPFDSILKKFDINTVSHWLPRKIRFRNHINIFLDYFVSEKPDFFYFYKDEGLTNKILTKLKSLSPNTKFIMFYGDQRGKVPQLIYERKDFLDALLITNEDSEQFKMYRDIGIKNIFSFYHGVPLEYFASSNDNNILYDVFFGGNYINNKKFPLSDLRYQFICSVKSLFNLVVYGSGWPFKTNTFIDIPEEYMNVIKLSNINLGINHYDVIRYYNRRLFESMASGRLHITKYIKGMEKHFENGKQLVWFDTIDQGISKIKYMLKHPEKREEIASAGKKIIFEQHNYDVRGIQFKNILEAIC